jgi:hypothetical protein
MLQTIQLKALCWPEELAGMAENKLNIDEEYSLQSCIYINIII